MCSEKVLVEASPMERASSHELPGKGGGEGDGGGDGDAGGGFGGDGEAGGMPVEQTSPLVKSQIQSVLELSEPGAHAFKQLALGVENVVELMVAAQSFEELKGLVATRRAEAPTHRL